MSPRREILAEEDTATAAPAADGLRPVDPGFFEGDAALEVGIRPKRLAEFVGQHLLREKL